MKPPKIRVFFSCGYTGAPKCSVYIDEIEHVVDIDYLEEYLLKHIEEKGYTTSMSKRQKYPRLIIND